MASIPIAVQTKSSDPLADLFGRSEQVNSLVEKAFETYLAGAFPDGLALLAVGGYGRRELFPHSDVDLLILVNRAVDGDAPRAALSAFLRELWDAGLRLSQSVRTIGDCCSVDVQNVELSISLIDQRFLTGDRGLYDKLAASLPRFFAAQRVSLMRHLLNLTQARHAKYQNTMFHLEPNVKETPGTIRDLHVIHWVDRLRAGDSIAVAELGPPKRFMAELRTRLHERFKRDANVLTFEVQNEISPDPAAWMREYFRHARTIYRAVQREIEMTEALTENSLLRQFRDWRSRLSNADFSVLRERVRFRAPLQLDGDPELVLRLFEFTARHGIAPAIETYRQISERIAGIAQYFATPRSVWPKLREILSLPHAPLALRAMHESGVMFAIFPEWHGIECLVVPDYYHRYTVDEHSLIAIEAVASLRQPRDPARKRFSDLLAETEDLPLLYAALLFHDVGKASGFEGHSERSMELASTALERIDMPEPQRRTVLSLIGHHLDLSVVMVGRDLDDPATIRDLAARVGTVETLKALTLLTFGDTDAVNPSAMTPWRLEQLWRVYMSTYNELTRELESDRIDAAKLGAEHSAFVAGLPTRYLRTHSADDIALHATLERQSRQGGVALELKRRAGVYDLTIVTPDRPGLFASITGALAAFGMNILKAEAFSNRNGNVVDTFVFADPMRTLELNPAEADRLKLTVQRAVLGREDVKKLLRARGAPLAARPKAKLQPTAAFDSSASQTATLVEIVAEDRPGLLYDLASAFTDMGCSIDVVLIDTEAHKALDVFYVTAKGAKLSPDTQDRLRARLLDVCAS